MNAGQGILVLDMNNYSFLHTTLTAPSAEDVARYTRPDGTTDNLGRTAFESGWYQGQGRSLAYSIKILLDALAERDKEIETLHRHARGE